MHFVLQNNLFEEAGWNELVRVLDRLEVRYSEHKVVPFSGDLDPEPVLEGGPVIAFGSYALSKRAVARGWAPGAFLGNLDFQIQRQHWGERMLNAAAHICRFDEVPEASSNFFMRPVHDTKAFTGFETCYADYVKWRDSLRRIPETADPVNDPEGCQLLLLGTPVMVCSLQEIDTETRCWVVDGKVVTASGYKVGTIRRQCPPWEVSPHILAFAQETADVWSPNQAYVMDIAETSQGLKVVEVNNLNSAGFYKANMQRLIEALVTLCEK